jgi:hypothetical protein
MEIPTWQNQVHIKNVAVLQNSWIYSLKLFETCSMYNRLL